ncbi:MAG: phenylalanine--tRNA ligase subunit beta [Cyanobacteriota bacterium ELA615]
MKISLNWLRGLVQIDDIDPEYLADKLTLAGLEVEAIENRQDWAKGVVIGKVLDCQSHPNASKLSVCQVDIGQSIPATIVCGAANVKSDIFVAVATLGSYLPQIDLKIKPATLRGIESSGMICSLTELGLAKESEGIHIFEQENLQVGQDVRPLLGLDDVIIEIAPTANRADALSMLGIAREVAALIGEPTIKTPILVPINQISAKSRLAVEVKNPHSCPIYKATLLQGVTIAPSPRWLQSRLQSAGIRPINNVVDATNYVLLEYGQPLHAFDLDSLEKIAKSENLTLGVRFAHAQESLQTLDSQLRNLNPENILITVNDNPIAIAGVIGGLESEVQDSTKNIILEVAIFNPIEIRRSAKSQGIRTEASNRYEKGVNLQALELAWQRAINLIQDLSGAQVGEIVTVDYRQQINSEAIHLRLKRIEQILGEGILKPQDIEKILQSLGCSLISNNEGWSVTVPDHREHDLQREIDLIEEIARLHGYDQFGYSLPKNSQMGTLSIEESLNRQIREAFRAAGLNELIHYSLVKPTGKEVLIANPLLAEYSALRYELLTGILDAFEYNQAQGNGSLNAFEIGRVFNYQGDDIQEEDLIAGVIAGNFFPLGRWVRSGKDQPMSWYQAKGLLNSAFERLSLVPIYQKDTEDERFHPGRTASIFLGKILIGRFGQLHPKIRQQRSLPEAVYLFELNLAPILQILREQTRALWKSYSTFPALERDLAFYAPLEVSVAQLEQTMSQSGGSLLEKVELFDQYQGETVPAGQRSLAFNLLYRVSDRTLKDSDIETVHSQIRDALVAKYQVTLRS